MNFFENQDRARSQTFRLVALFILALLIIVAAINLAVFAALFYANGSSSAYLLPALSGWIKSALFWQVNGAVIALILAGSLYRLATLAKGGKALAGMTGATPVSELPDSPQLQQLRNVVEEMAIAAGLPAPPLFILEHESSINAFVAGYQQDDAIMVVTRGLLDNLDRNQIQGVVGHEFSHILNGDMRLNIRLISVLAGILMISRAGEILIRLGGRSSGSNKKGNALPVAAIGLAFIVIGMIGVFFGRWIKAAVSRQREFLADASSVQFTRNPDAIAGALYQIHQHAQGTVLSNEHREDISHLCIAPALAPKLFSEMLATHPDIQERIRRVSPHFLTRQKHRDQHDMDKITEQTRRSHENRGSTGPEDLSSQLGASLAVAALAGTTEKRHLELARQLYRDIPVGIRDILHSSAGARGFVYALLLPHVPQQQQTEAEELLSADSQGLSYLHKLQSWVSVMPESLRLPALGIASAALKQEQEDQSIRFLKQLEALIRLDDRVLFDEWLVVQWLRHQLLPEYLRRRSVHRYSIASLSREIQLLLSFLVQLSDDSKLASTEALQAIQSLGIQENWVLSPDTLGFDQLDRALLKLDNLPAVLKGNLLQCCADIILADRKINIREYEYLRLVSGILHCPLPPLADNSGQIYQP